jgi:hypothetical protein
MKYKSIFCVLCALALLNLRGADSLTPYAADSVPRNALELWKDVDPRKDDLETEVIREWREEGVVCRYVLFKVGSFKGADSRIAAFYTFPEGMKKGPAFVWAHGGGQRAERERGTYFAKQGFATIDINWGGREMVEGIQANTDWGRVDPSQGPGFYPGALRPNVKLNLLPDEHTIDPVVSPRNGNWYLLAYAGRRAVTFLERQPEVDAGKIGFTGYSMGGNITSMVAIDDRLKAVVPMVGGSGFIMEDFPGLPETGRARGFKEVDLYNRTIDARSYWPHVKCPVLFLSASDDFHAVFDNLYKSAGLIPHGNWRASQLMHYNHSLGPQQWILLNRWFERHLDGKGVELPGTPKPTVKPGDSKTFARFGVSPDRADEVVRLDVYYSHDANARARFWKHVEADRSGGRWSAQLPMREHLPLYAFANITYPLAEPAQSFGGETSTYTITSDEYVYLPEKIESNRLRAEAKNIPVFEDFDQHGFRDWGFSPHGGVSTYKFQDPDREIPGADQVLRVTVNVPREKLSYRFRVGRRSFLAGVKGPSETYFFSRNLKPSGPQELLLRVSDFVDSKKKPMSDWKEISTFRFDVYDGAARVGLHFDDPANTGLISKMEWVHE